MGFSIAPAPFAEAVTAIDRGDVSAIRSAVAERPQLLTETALLSGDLPGAYFDAPRLLWFVAENPIRNRTLPGNIAEVAEVLLDLSRAGGVPDLDAVASYALGLIASGCVPREAGVQAELIATLVAGGAAPDGAVRPALAHGEREAAKALREAGAQQTLFFAAGMGDEARVPRLAEDAGEDALQDALAVAVINREAGCVRLLLAGGADPNRYCPEGLHAFSTPLHQAAFGGDISSIDALLAAGAATDIRDKTHGATAPEWARHAGQDAALARLIAGS